MYPSLKVYVDKLRYDLIGWYHVIRCWRTKRRKTSYNVVSETHIQTERELKKLEKQPHPCLLQLP